MTYHHNPKTAGSGIICAIPQTGECPQRCADCFFRSGRSYLEPLDDNLPNMPSVADAMGRVVRVNDGNDSSNDREAVMLACRDYPHKFYNTSIPRDLEGFDAPVVLTLNPAKMTDKRAHLVEPLPRNLMFVRVRTSVWNQYDVVDSAVEYYTARDVPVVLTFMAYFDEPVRDGYEHFYMVRKRTTNTYMAITTDAWRGIMARYERNPLVYSCGHVEGERGQTGCKHCGNCLREYFATVERME